METAYGPSLRQVLYQISHGLDKAAYPILDVLIQVPWTPELRLNTVQHLIATAYRLICSLSIELSIDVQFNNEVDCQVHLFHQSSPSEAKGRKTFPDLIKIARSDVPWGRVFSPESEPGVRLIRDFVAIHDENVSSSGSKLEVERVPAGLSVDSLSSTITPQPSEQGLIHTSVAVGGTFDHLHVGHKLLLSMTALVLNNDGTGGKERHLIIGITGDELLKKKRFAEELEAWEVRQSRVQEFLLAFLFFFSTDNVLADSSDITGIDRKGREIRNQLKSGVNISYVEIFDPFGPTVTDPTVSALVISGETRSGGKAVNDKRSEKGWQPLEIFEVEVLDPTQDANRESTDDFQGKISSTEIRSRLHQNRVKTSERAVE